MNTKIKNGLLLAVVFLTAFSNKATSQKLNKDAVAFTQTLQDNYNKGDLPALMTMYADEVNIIHADGTMEKVPKKYYEDDYIRDFSEAGGSNLTFKVDNTETLPDGKIKISGSFDGYDFDRKTNAKLNPDKGTFENVITKDGDKWKLSQIKTTYAMTQIAREIRTFTQDYQDAYNRKDADAMKSMYTVDAERISADGKSIKGAQNIAAYYKDDFDNSNVALTLKGANIQPQFDGSLIVTGSYSAYGMSAKGDRISLTGSYKNKLLNENGQWKLAQIKLGDIVKTISFIKVADFAKWKAGFDAYRRIRLDAGELTYETGTLANDAGTAYVITEWASFDNVKAFLTTPELKAHMQKEGVQGIPQTMFLDKK